MQGSSRAVRFRTGDSGPEAGGFKTGKAGALLITGRELSKDRKHKYARTHLFQSDVGASQESWAVWCYWYDYVKLCDKLIQI